MRVRDARTAGLRVRPVLARADACSRHGRRDRTSRIPSALDDLSLKVSLRPDAERVPSKPVLPTRPGAAVEPAPAAPSASVAPVVAAAPARARAIVFTAVREFLAAPSEAVEPRIAAAALGWANADDGAVTDAGARLIATAPGSAEESEALAAALLENPPLSAVASALLLGEWLELQDLAPALARTLGLSATHAATLAPSLLAWRTELRERGWNPRAIAKHLHDRTRWMKSVAPRTRELLSRRGVVTRDQVLAIDGATLRDDPQWRPEHLKDLERWRVQLGKPLSTSSPAIAAALAARPRALDALTISAGSARDVPVRPRVVTYASEGFARPSLAHDLDSRVYTASEDAGDYGDETLDGLDDDDDVLEDDDVIDPPTRALIETQARKLLERRGCTSVGAVARAVGAVPLAGLREVLEARMGVQWLDDDRAWFFRPSARDNPLRQGIERVLVERGPQSIAGLHVALRELGLPDLPPVAVLAALCGVCDRVELIDGGTRARARASTLAEAAARQGRPARATDDDDADGDDVDVDVADGDADDDDDDADDDADDDDDDDGDGDDDDADVDAARGALEAAPPTAIPDDMTVAELVRMAGITVEQLVAAALGKNPDLAPGLDDLTVAPPRRKGGATGRHAPAASTRSSARTRPKR